MEVVLMSRDPRARALMALTVRSIERRLDEPLRFRAAANGELAARAVLRDRPEIVIADEIASRMGAFALARSLRDDAMPYTGVIVILLDRVYDEWLASWSGADAWFVKPADPFAVADRVWELLEERGLVPPSERLEERV
jgi:DNA-binding response OmpR family regulator